MEVAGHAKWCLRFRAPAWRVMGKPQTIISISFPWKKTINYLQTRDFHVGYPHVFPRNYASTAWFPHLDSPWHPQGSLVSLAASVGHRHLVAWVPGVSTWFGTWTSGDFCLHPLERRCGCLWNLWEAWPRELGDVRDRCRFFMNFLSRVLNQGSGNWHWELSTKM